MPRFPGLVLRVGGSCMLVAGIAGVVLGVGARAWLASLLPRVVIDQAAVGGAAVALGSLVGIAGLAQLALVMLHRGSPWTAAAAATVSGLLGALGVALSVTLATVVAAGASPWLLAGSGACLAIGLAYGIGAWRLAQAPR